MPDSGSKTWGQIRPQSVRLLAEVISSTFLTVIQKYKISDLTLHAPDNSFHTTFLNFNRWDFAL